MQGMVGPMVAAYLGLPCATSVISAKLERANRYMLVEREIEGGHRDILRVRLPAVICVQSGINHPRYPSLSNLLRAGQQELRVITSSDLPIRKNHQKVLEIALPQNTRAANALEGSLQEKAEQLLTILREKALMQ